MTKSWKRVGPPTMLAALLTLRLREKRNLMMRMKQKLRRNQSLNMKQRWRRNER